MNQSDQTNDPVRELKIKIHSGPMQELAMLIVHLKELEDKEVNKLIKLAEKISRELRQIAKI